MPRPSPRCASSSPPRPRSASASSTGRAARPSSRGCCSRRPTGGIGVGIVVWAKRYMPDEETTEERHPVESSEEDIAAFAADFETGEASLRGPPAAHRIVRRRHRGARRCAAVPDPLARSSSRTRPEDHALRRADEAGRARRRHPDPARRHLDRRRAHRVPRRPHPPADAPTLLIRYRPDQDFKTQSGREGWTVDRIVAYSKLCTHVGCPVGLYQADEGLLLCPCHQSTFDVLDGARPVFGPAARVAAPAAARRRRRRLPRRRG